MIVGKERFPDVRFFLSSEFRKIGSLGEVNLIQVGVSNETNEPVVARSTVEGGDYANEELYPAYLHEVITHAAEDLVLDEGVAQT